MITPPNITFVLGVLAIIFSVYNSFRNPQIKSNENDLLLSAAVMQLTKDFANLRDNHIHSIDQKISEQDKAISGMAVELAKLTTIIDERIPKRKNI